MKKAGGRLWPRPHTGGRGDCVMLHIEGSSLIGALSSQYAPDCPQRPINKHKQTRCSTRRPRRSRPPPRASCRGRRTPRRRSATCCSRAACGARSCGRARTCRTSSRRASDRGARGGGGGQERGPKKEEHVHAAAPRTARRRAGDAPLALGSVRLMTTIHEPKRVGYNVNEHLVYFSWSGKRALIDQSNEFIQFARAPQLSSQH